MTFDEKYLELLERIHEEVYRYYWKAFHSECTIKYLHTENGIKYTEPAWSIDSIELPILEMRKKRDELFMKVNNINFYWSKCTRNNQNEKLFKNYIVVKNPKKSFLKKIVSVKDYLLGVIINSLLKLMSNPRFFIKRNNDEHST